MTTDRRLALWAGILYLATFATSFPALALKTPLLERGAERGASASRSPSASWPRARSRRR